MRPALDLDGETARAETHVMSYHRVDMGAGYRDATMGGRYLDRLEKREGGKDAAFGGAVQFGHN